MENVISVSHLRKSFGSHEVLRDVDFSAAKGEVTCIIGSSGSGKSTLLRCINLLETPDAGQILFHGEDIQRGKMSMPQYHARVGMVFQQFNLFNNMTVLKNCMLRSDEGAGAQRRRKRKERHAVSGKGGHAGVYPRQAPPAVRRPEAARCDCARAEPWTPRCCSSTSRPLRSTRKWWARCWP